MYLESNNFLPYVWDQFWSADFRFKLTHLWSDPGRWIPHFLVWRHPRIYFFFLKYYYLSSFWIKRNVTKKKNVHWAIHQKNNVLDISSHMFLEILLDYIFQWGEKLFQIIHKPCNGFKCKISLFDFRRNGPFDQFKMWFIYGHGIPIWNLTHNPML